MTSPKRMRNMSSYDAAVRAFAKMNQDMAKLRNFIQSPNLEVFFQMDQMIDKFRLNHVNIRQALLPSQATSIAPLGDILTASSHFHDVLAKTSVSISTGGMVHESWRNKIGSLPDFSAQLAATAKISVGENAFQLAATETIWAGIDFDFLESQFDLPLSSISAMEQSLVDVTVSYRALAESFPDLSAVVQMPSFVLPGSTFELFTTGYALDVLLPSDQQEETELESEISHLAEDCLEALYFVDLLERVNPQLVQLYLGARKDLYGNDPDRKRHVLASLRELWNWVIREIAPQEETSNWISVHGKEGDLDPNNRPSRRGKVRYISRNISSKPFTDFVANTAKASTDLHCIYGRVHELEPGLDESQLRAVYYKTVSELSFLIQVSLTTT